jgi:hypothetical protein
MLSGELTSSVVSKENIKASICKSKSWRALLDSEPMLRVLKKTVLQKDNRCIRLHIWGSDVMNFQNIAICSIYVVLIELTAVALNNLFRCSIKFEIFPLQFSDTIDHGAYHEVLHLVLLAMILIKLVKTYESCHHWLSSHMIECVDLLHHVVQTKLSWRLLVKIEHWLIGLAPGEWNSAHIL